MLCVKLQVYKMSKKNRQNEYNRVKALDKEIPPCLMYEFGGGKKPEEPLIQDPDPKAKKLSAAEKGALTKAKNAEAKKAKETEAKE